MDKPIIVRATSQLKSTPKELFMKSAAQLSRRNFLQGKVIKTHLPRLPWALDEPIFLAGCQQCNKCIEVCENRIIQRDQLGYPFVDFDHDECTFCMKCINVCPAKIFHKNRENKPWQGKFTINQQCLASNDIYCQSCRDVCEPQAIQFSHNDSHIPAPTLNHNNCSQCGACVSVCPQDAISLDQSINDDKRIKVNYINE